MLKNGFRENVLEGDPTCLYNTAQALRTIQQLYGSIPRVFGKGPAAKQVLICTMNVFILTFTQLILKISTAIIVNRRIVLILPVIGFIITSSYSLKVLDYVAVLKHPVQSHHSQEILRRGHRREDTAYAYISFHSLAVIHMCIFIHFH